MDEFLAAFFAACMLAVEHWFPWRLLLRRPLPRIPSYVLGVLALYLPVTAVLVYRHQLDAVWLLWIVAAAGGLAVAICYAVDAALHLHAAARADDQVQGAGDDQ